MTSPSEEDQLQPATSENVFVYGFSGSKGRRETAAVIPDRTCRTITSGLLQQLNARNRIVSSSRPGPHSHGPGNYIGHVELRVRSLDCSLPCHNKKIYCVVEDDINSVIILSQSICQPTCRGKQAESAPGILPVVKRPLSKEGSLIQCNHYSCCIEIDS